SHYSERLFSCPAAGSYVGRVSLFDDAESNCAADQSVIAATVGDGDSRHPARGAATTDRKHDSGVHNDLLTCLGSDEQAIAKLPGMRSAFVVDNTSGKSILFNDRYGRERLFVHSNGTRTFFSSEAKAILAVVPETRSFDPTGLAELLACGCTLGSTSLFKGIEVLPSGTVVTFSRSGTRRRRYFDPASLEHLEPLPSKDFIDG